MFARLRASGQVCTQVQFICRCENGKVLSRSWNLGVEVSSKDLVERIKYQLDTVTVGGSGSESLGAVSQIELHPLRVVDARQAMTPLWGRNADPPQELDQAARNASSLLGKNGVRVPHLTSGYDPRSVIELKTWQERGAQRRPHPRVGTLSGVAPEIVFMHPKPAGIIDSSGREILLGRDGQLKAPVKWVQVAGRKIEVQKNRRPLADKWTVVAARSSQSARAANLSSGLRRARNLAAGVPQILLVVRCLGRAKMSGYIELHAHSAYSFAVGACSPREMVRGAKKLGLSGLALLDYDGVYGLMEARAAAREAELPSYRGANLL